MDRESWNRPERSAGSRLIHSACPGTPPRSALYLQAAGDVMKRGLISATVSLVLVMSMALVPTPVRAEGLRDGHGDRQGGGSVGVRPSVSRPSVPQSSMPRPSVPRPFSDPRRSSDPRRFSHRPSVSFGFGVPVYVAPPVFYGSPSYYDPPVAYDPPAVYAPSTNTVSVAPDPPPPPGVIEYPTGRYELRGDGVATPYAWVWVPNPPPAPPEAAPLAAAPALPEAPAPAGQSPGRRELYRWTDEQGVVTLTDRWDSIPEKYRHEAKRLSL